MPKKEEKHKNEELIGCTVLFKTDDGIIRSATISSVSPSKKFLHSGDANIWIDPEQIVDTIHDPNVVPEPEPVVEEKPVTVRQETTEIRTAKAPPAAAKKEEPKKKKW
jgi:hypothetical protein